MGGQERQRAPERQRGTRRMEAGGLVAVELVARRIDLDLHLCALGGPQLSGMLERRDRIALAKMHQHGAARFFGDEWADLGGVVADCRRNSVDVNGRAPGNRAAPAIAEGGDLSGSAQLCLCCNDIGEYLIPRYLAAQVAAGGRILLRIAELDPGTNAVE